jgi:hypothetical protein
VSKNIKIKMSKTITLPVALYGCDTSTQISGVEYRLKVFGNRVLRRISGLKRGVILG